MKVGIKKTVDVNVTHVRVFLKIRDEGSYTFTDEDGEVVHSIEEDYVPNSIIPGEYGDYIDLKIDLETGQIVNWPKASEVERALRELIDGDE